MSDDPPAEMPSPDPPGEQRNVYGDPLVTCSDDPETGALRDGHCRHLRRDPGRHEVCAVMTEDFLKFSKTMGNDLVTPRPELSFPGLEPGDHWCVCLPRWQETLGTDSVPPVVPEATNEAVLEAVPLELLEEHAYEE